MLTPGEQPQRPNTYFTNPENAAEMARLMKQSRFLTRNMGGLFADRFYLSHSHDILDVACGPGRWVLDVAITYPEIQVTGVDLSQLMVDYALAQAEEKGLQNAHFRVMDVLKPLDFPDNSFDFINTRLLFGFMPPAAWPKLMQECMRITRPGGMIRLNECEFGISNGSASEELSSMFARALHVSGQSFSPDGRHVGITPMLGRFLRDAGYQDIQNTLYTIDYSADTENHADGYQDLVVFHKLVQPLLVKTGVTTQEEAEHLYQQMLEELQSPDFCGIWYYLSVWGKKQK